LFNLTIKGEETTRKYSWIEKSMATIFLEAAKHALSCTDSVAILSCALPHLNIVIPAQLKEHEDKLYVWRELAKALIRKKLDDYNDSSSRSSSFSGSSATLPASFYKQNMAIDQDTLRVSPRRQRSSVDFESTLQGTIRTASSSSSTSTMTATDLVSGLPSPRRSGVISSTTGEQRVAPMRSMNLTKSLGGADITRGDGKNLLQKSSKN